MKVINYDTAIPIQFCNDVDNTLTRTFYLDNKAVVHRLKKGAVDANIKYVQHILSNKKLTLDSLDLLLFQALEEQKSNVEIAKDMGYNAKAVSTAILEYCKYANYDRFAELMTRNKLNISKLVRANAKYFIKPIPCRSSATSTVYDLIASMANDYYSLSNILTVMAYCDVIIRKVPTQKSTKIKNEALSKYDLYKVTLTSKDTDTLYKAIVVSNSVDVAHAFALSDASKTFDVDVESITVVKIGTYSGTDKASIMLSSCEDI